MTQLFRIFPGLLLKALQPCLFSCQPVTDLLKFIFPFFHLLFRVGDFLVQFFFPGHSVLRDSDLILQFIQKLFFFLDVFRGKQRKDRWFRCV